MRVSASATRSHRNPSAGVLAAGVLALLWPQSARAQQQPVEPSGVEPCSVEPGAVEPNSVDPNSLDPNSVDPSSIEPTSVEAPRSGLEPSVEPSVAPTSVAASSVEEAPVEEAAPVDTSPFARGRIRISALIGTGFAGDDDYLVLGAGLGYFVLKGVELGLDYEMWILGDPTFHRLSPGIRYVLDLKAVKPYVGVFYRHTFVSDYDDFNQVGARAGVYIKPKGPVFFGGGAVYERLLGCDDNSLVDCDSVYPEVVIGVSL